MSALNLVPTEWGKRIKRLRRIRGWTMEDLAKKTGVQKSTVSQWELGRIKNMEGDTMLSVAKALEVTPEWLLFGDVPIAPPTPAMETDGYLTELVDRLKALPISRRVIILQKCYELIEKYISDEDE